MAKPFLKWVGGKTRLLPELIKRVPKEFETYIEPFLGGGSLFFELNPKKAILSDTNQKLIWAYKAIKKDPEEVIKNLTILQSEHDTDLYKNTVEMYNRDDLVDTGYGILLIYLNKTCFNGLYRENSKGKYNVPIGKYSKVNIFDAENIRECSKVLKNAELKSTDFLLHKNINKGNFYYIDPPYFSSYTSYGKIKFGEYEHFKLYQKLLEINRAGAKWMLSNSNEDLILDLYKNFNIEEVNVRRSISCKGEGRGQTTEVIIRNYE